MSALPMIYVDERGRTNLSKVRSHNFDRYLADEDEQGTIVLVPAVSISAAELAQLRARAQEAAS